MRTPPVSLRFARHTLPALALSAAGLFVPAHPALTQGLLTFDRLAVEDCSEMGPCEWKLSCKVGNGKAEDLVPNSAGAEGSEIEIGKRRPVDRFPVQVTCSAWEDDGWIGTSWKDVQTKTVSLPAGGDYSLDLASDDQGKVRILMRADSLEIGTLPPAGGPRRFIGVYRDSKAGQAVVVGMPWPALEARRAAFAKQEIYPTALETYVEGKTRLWNAVFQSSPDEHQVVTGLEWDPFRARLDELRQRGMRLIHFTTYADGKKRLFAGIFRHGTEDNALRVGKDRASFHNEWAKLAGDGLRLVDLQVYRAGNSLLYAGTFLNGSGSYGLRTALTRDELLARAQEASGGRLIDVATYEDGKKRLYDAVFLGAGKSALDADVDLPTFAQRWREHVGQGLRLVQMHTYPE
jgi:Polyglycine hydrolase-like, structural repeat